MSDFVETIERDDTLFGMVIRKELTPGSTEFFTDASLPLQVGLFVHGADYEEPAHTHQEIPREIDQTHQVLHLTRGSMTITFSTEEGTHVGELAVREGDTVLLADGAHSVEASEPIRAVTVKQGPYLGEDDDIRWLEESDG